MGKYNPFKLDKNKYGILGIYIEKLEELQKGKIPTQFETYAEILKEALPFFPEKERQKYQEILEAGLNQIEYIRASKIVDSLKQEENSRKKTIENFLNN